MKKQHSIEFADSLKILIAAKKLDPQFRQYFALFYLMLSTGLRANEIFSLTVNKINFDESCIIVEQRKTKLLRSVFLTDIMKDELKKYLAHPKYQEWANKGNKEVFFKNNRKLCYQSMNYIIKSVCLSAGVNNVTSSSFNATTAKLFNIRLSVEIIAQPFRRTIPTLRYIIFPLDYKKDVIPKL